MKVGLNGTRRVVPELDVEVNGGLLSVIVVVRSARRDLIDGGGELLGQQSLEIEVDAHGDVLELSGVVGGGAIDSRATKDHGLALSRVLGDRGRVATIVVVDIETEATVGLLRRRVQRERRLAFDQIVARSTSYLLVAPRFGCRCRRQLFIVAACRIVDE